MLRNIEGAIFDMDGTLIDSLCVWQIIWDEFGNKFLNGAKFNIKDSDNKKVRTMTLKDAMEYLNSEYSIGRNGVELFNVAEIIIADFYASRVALKKGVHEFLEYCYQNKIKMCIASATDRKLIDLALEHCGIKKYFSHIVSCSEMGKGKDEPDVYLKAMALLGIPVESTCVFEDSHIAIQTASDIGMKTVGIYDENNYDYDKTERIATAYIGRGETLQKLIN